MVRQIETSSAFSQVINKRLTEGLFILTLSISLFMLLSLATYQSQDPGIINNYYLGQEIANAGGRVGAWLADLLMVCFGYLSYIFPLSFIYIAWLILKEQRSSNLERGILLLRFAGLFLVVISGCGLISNLSILNGGVLGAIIIKLLNSAFNEQGTLVILISCLLGGLTLLTGLSWLALTENIGKITLITFKLVVQLMRNNYVKFREKLKALYIERKNKIKTEVRRQKIVINEIPSSVDKSSMLEKVKQKIVIKPKVEKSETSKRYKKDQQIPLFDTRRVGALPSLNMLHPAEKLSGKGYSKDQLENMSRDVEQRLLDFNIDVQVVAVHPGPVITRFELELAPGVKVSKISALVKDLARSLSVHSVRIVEVIPGKSVVGLEVPNKYREMVRLSEVLSTKQYEKSNSPLSIALGVDISGNPKIVDLAKMPHLLVAGTTGAGKSVGLNAMLLSLLFNSTPKQVRLILIDPKMLELAMYDGIPHLLTPVVTDMKEAANSLRWSVAEMERRYRLMAALGVRNIAGYNQKVKAAIDKGEPLVDPLWKKVAGESPPTLEMLPYVVLVIDELADMMMVVGKKVEQLIARIAQKARASGIHLILATQRPSVDVLTGLIKANIPTRISYQVSSKIDSRTILDQQGAEQLLGHGDLLYLAPGTGTPLRVHGAFVADSEVRSVVNSWREKGDPQYIESITNHNETTEIGLAGSLLDLEDRDVLYDEAVEFVLHSRKASISAVQRRLKVGYNRAARLVEEMERAGILGPMESNGVREILVPQEKRD